MRPEEITPAWLGEVLGLPVRDTTCERVGTGLMAMNFRYRLTLDGDAPEGAPTSVVAKLPADDETSRATGFNLGSYEREVRFYDELAPSLAIRTPTVPPRRLRRRRARLHPAPRGPGPGPPGRPDRRVHPRAGRGGHGRGRGPPRSPVERPEPRDRPVAGPPARAGAPPAGPVPGVLAALLRHVRQVPHARAAGARRAVRRGRWAPSSMACPTRPPSCTATSGWRT